MQKVLFSLSKEMTKRTCDELNEQIASQIKIDEYNKYTWKRILNLSKYAPCHPNNGLATNCLYWCGYIDKDGYGQISYGGKMIGVHSASLMILLKINAFPEENGKILQVAHKCNVRHCCEPSHLYHATIEQNNVDRVKIESGLGEKNPNAKTKEDIARAIKLSKGDGSKKERAIRFGVTRSIVNNIDSGMTWGHLPDKTGKVLSVEERIKKNKKRQKKRKLAKEKPWTMEFYEKAKVRIDSVPDNPKYSFGGSYCKLWNGTLKDGYPQMYIDGKELRGHIVACSIANNYTRIDDLFASHECGQSECVNPLHLTFKSHQENMKDKLRHGTDNRKISYEIVVDIRKRRSTGQSKVSIARLYSLSTRYVSDIINMKVRISD